jgi:hypothetical protein
MPGLLLIATGIGLLVGAFVAHYWGNDAHQAALSTSVGATKALGAPVKPPVAREGQPIFAIPQRMWGKCKCCTYGPSGWSYVIEFPSGTGVVLGDNDVTVR